mmetsp:Transcript_50653/g.118329  ORF Transcript_50653/g.118329 Transcript_50653/m.118329 type:complete len:236 (+) Transcript_50653:77-784(+)
MEHLPAAAREAPMERLQSPVLAQFHQLLCSGVRSQELNLSCEMVQNRCLDLHAVLDSFADDGGVNDELLDAIERIQLHCVTQDLHGCACACGSTAGELIESPNGGRTDLVQHRLHCKRRRFESLDMINGLLNNRIITVTNNQQNWWCEALNCVLQRREEGAAGVAHSIRQGALSNDLAWGSVEEQLWLHLHLSACYNNCFWLASDLLDPSEAAALAGDKVGVAPLQLVNRCLSCC